MRVKGLSSGIGIVSIAAGHVAFQRLAVGYPPGRFGGRVDAKCYGSSVDLWY